MLKEVTKDTFLIEILEDNKAKKILEKYQLPCLNCPFASFGLERLKLGEVCEIYQIDLENLLKELNEAIKNNQ